MNTVNVYFNIMNTFLDFFMFHERLKQERERLGISQTAFGEQCGVKKLAQINYEKGERKPDSDYLQKAQQLGVDIGFLFSGLRTNVATMPTDEIFLLDNFRKLSEQEKRMFLGFMIGGVQSMHDGGGVFNSPNANVTNSFNR